MSADQPFLFGFADCLKPIDMGMPIKPDFTIDPRNGISYCGSKHLGHHLAKELEFNVFTSNPFFGSLITKPTLSTLEQFITERKMRGLFEFWKESAGEIK